VDFSQGSLGCFEWIIRLVFWVLLWLSRDELGPGWFWGLAIFWLAGWWISTLVPGGPYLFMSLLALVDIALVLVVFQGDVRIT
jgi:hypothetical protein